MLSRLVMISSWIVTFLAVALGAAFLLIVETQRPGPPAPNGQAMTTIVVPRGVGIGAIGGHLEAERVVRNALAFRVGVMIYGRNRSLKAGEYAIPSGESLADVIERLAAGRVVLHAVTAPEGWTTAMIVDMLATSEVLEGDTPATPAEGTLLPETYRIERGADRASVLRKMEQAQDDLMAELWPGRATNLPFKTQRGFDPGLHRRKGNRRGQRTPARGCGVRQQAAQGHAAAFHRPCRSPWRWPVSAWA